MLNKTKQVAPNGSTMTLVDVSQRSDEWLDWRSQGITATDVSVILGLSPYKTPWQLWAEKTGQINPPDLSNNPHVQRGVKLEDTCRQLAEEKYGELLLPLCGEAFDHDFMRASFDGVDLNHEVYEFKCPGEKVFFDAKENGIESDAFKLYESQVQAQLTVSGNNKGHLIFYYEGEELLDFPVDLSAEKRKEIIDVSKVFWDLVVTKKPPKTDPVRDMFIPDNGNKLFTWQATAEQWRLQNSKITSIKAELKLLEAKKKETQTKLTKQMGQFMQADHSGVKISRFVKQGNVDYQAFLKDEFPDKNFKSQLENHRKKSRSEVRFTASKDELVNHEEEVVITMKKAAYF